MTVARLRRRRDGYARYSELILAQLEALDADDFDALRALADERDSLAARIDRGEAVDIDPGPSVNIDPGQSVNIDPGQSVEASSGDAAFEKPADDGASHGANPEDESVDWLHSEIRMILETCRDREARLRERLLQARDDALGAVRSHEERAPRIQGYAEPAGRASRVDVRL